MVAVLDYRAGNITSVRLALERIGEPSEVTADPERAARAHALILPGVGAFSQAMENLRESGLIPVLCDAARRGKPLLGICLGMQALFEGSEEGPGVPGLGLIPGTVRRLRGWADESGHPLKIPHMGWNDLRFERESPLRAGLPQGAYVYFVHSYACHPSDAADTVATAEYGERFCAAVHRGTVFGTQFHPEKSGDAGERMLRGFLAFAKRGK